MTEALIIIGVTAGAFIGTNLDNLLLLAAMHIHYKGRSGIVTAGYFVGMMLVGAVTLLIGQVGDIIPLTYLGFLGLIPIMMGLFSLWKLCQNQQTEEVTSVTTRGTRSAIFFAIVGSQLSNSADSIITFSALFADSSDPADYIAAPTFLAMAGIFSGMAYYSAKHPTLSRLLGRHGPYITPFILILVGYYILSNTASDLAT